MNDDKQFFKSILEMRNGGFMEATDLELTKAIQNIRDVNTNPTKPRKITITITLKPDDSRQNIKVDYCPKATLCPIVPQVTMLYDNGENVREMTPQMPGQLNMDGSEQYGPPLLRLIS